MTRLTHLSWVDCSLLLLSGSQGNDAGRYSGSVPAWLRREARKGDTERGKVETQDAARCGMIPLESMEFRGAWALKDTPEGLCLTKLMYTKFWCSSISINNQVLFITTNQRFSR